jgi:hypothetical protein
MRDYFYNLDQAVKEVSIKHEINNLLSIEDPYDKNGYWSRLVKLSFFNKLFDEHRYHFLYEIQGLSTQIHFGIVNCIMFKNQISTERGRPNVYNHRYTFMIESTIHCIYSFWNRVGMVLNTYLKKPKAIKRIYFSNVVSQLSIDYPSLSQDKFYQWISSVKIEVELLDRNEFAHNNSLIMQNFIASRAGKTPFDNLLEMPDLLLSHNKTIVDEIYNLVELLEILEGMVAKQIPSTQNAV